MSVAIEQMTRRDIKRILEIELAQFDEPWTEGMLRDELARSTRRYTKALQGSEIVGYCGVMYVEADAHVNTIATAPGHEGQGVATALLKDALLVAIERGVRDMSLEVAVRNERARRLYERFGFAPLGVRKGYYRVSGDDALVMFLTGLDTPEVRERVDAVGAAST